MRHHAVHHPRSRAAPNFTYKLKILVSFVQIGVRLSQAGGKWPAIFVAFMSYFNFFNFDVWPPLRADYACTHCTERG